MCGQKLDNSSGGVKRGIFRGDLCSFRTDSCSLAGDSLEAGFDAGDGAAWAAGFALQEEESGVLLQDCVGGFAGVTGDIFLDVATQDILNLLGLEASLNDQLIVAIHWATCAQFRQQVIQKMLRQPMQHLADLHEVGKGGLLGANSQYLWRSHHEFRLSARRHLGILVQNDLEHSLKEFVVSIVAIRASPGGIGILNCKGKWLEAQEKTFLGNFWGNF